MTVPWGHMSLGGITIAWVGCEFPPQLAIIQSGEPLTSLRPGLLLVASNDVPESSIFHKCVVLLLEYSADGGAKGIILNNNNHHCGDETLLDNHDSLELFDNFREVLARGHVVCGIGGPVDRGVLTVVHDIHSLASQSDFLCAKETVCVSEYENVEAVLRHYNDTLYPASASASADPTTRNISRKHSLKSTIIHLGLAVTGQSSSSSSLASTSSATASATAQQVGQGSSRAGVRARLRAVTTVATAVAQRAQRSLARSLLRTSASMQQARLSRGRGGRGAAEAALSSAAGGAGAVAGARGVARCRRGGGAEAGGPVLLSSSSVDLSEVLALSSSPSIAAALPSPASLKKQVRISRSTAGACGNATQSGEASVCSSSSNREEVVASRVSAAQSLDQTQMTLSLPGDDDNTESDDYCWECSLSPAHRAAELQSTTSTLATTQPLPTLSSGTSATRIDIHQQQYTCKINTNIPSTDDNMDKRSVDIHVRLVKGRSHWHPLQLDGEIRSGVWHTTSIKRELIFPLCNDTTLLWDQLSRQLDIRQNS